MEKNVGVFHTYIASKLRERCKRYSNILKRKEVMETLWKHRVPTELRHCFLQEMQDYKLIKVKDKQNILIKYKTVKDEGIIRQMSKRGKTQNQIAAELGVNQTIIHRCLKKNDWFD